MVFQSYPTRGVSDFQQTTVAGTSTAYDALDRVTEVREDADGAALVTKTEYLSGFQRLLTNPRGQVSTEQFQAFETPDYGAPVLVNLPEGVSTLITRDRYGKPLEITRSGPEG
jgi:hypothetical protein